MRPSAYAEPVRPTGLPAKRTDGPTAGRAWVGLLVVAAACGGGSSSSLAIDSAVPGDAAPTAIGAHHRYVVSHELLPMNNNQARDFGLDLDDDNVIDNQLGMVLGTFSSMGFEAQTTADRLVDDGGILMLLDVQSDDFTTMLNAGLSIFSGATPMPAPCASSADTVCRRHLAGTGGFTVAPTSARDPQLIGAFTNATFATHQSSNVLHIQLAVVDGASAPITLGLIGARVKATGVRATRITSLNLAGGVPATEIHTTLIPGLHSGYAAAVQRDCSSSGTPPGCGCAPGSVGGNALGLFDGNLAGTQKDCKVSLAEVEGSSVVQALLVPDVMIDGTMALSLGIRVDAVAATFTP